MFEETAKNYWISESCGRAEVLRGYSTKMADEPLRTTLAYTKSPKTSKRTTFQDELEAAISARAKHTAAQKSTISYSDDFDDDDDDILDELLKTRRKKMDIFKTGRSKTKNNNFQLSDEEEENVRPKKVSFLKSERRSMPVQDDQPDSARRSDTAGSSDSQRSLPEGGDHNTHSDPQSDPPADWKIQSESSSGRKSQSESLVSRKSLSESPLPLNSENSRWDSPVPAEGALYDSPQALSSERGDDDLLRALIGEDSEHPPPQPRERSARQRPPTGLVEDKPPRPRPRQRGAPVGSSGHDEGDGSTETPSSRAATSSVSIPLSFSDRNTTMSVSSHRLGSFGSDGVQIAEEPYTASVRADTLSSSPTQRTTEALLSPLEGAVSSDLFLNENTGDKYSTSSHQNPQSDEDPTGLTVSRQSHRSNRSQDRPPSSRPLSSRKSRSACSSYSAQSRYLGSLKVLDQKQSVQELQPDTTDSLRAAVYQDWLKKKEEKLQEALKLKKQEEKLKEEKKMEEEMSKKAGAKASYEAWKEKKQETLKEKLREKQEVLKKQQKEQEEKEEKKETAKRVFEKWKQEHEERLQEQHLKQTQQKNRLKGRKEREQEERRRDCSSSFSLWSEKKKDTLQEKLKEEQEKEKIKEIEEKYEKEEREKTALEMYEKWLKRKEFQQKREKQEKKIKAIVQDEPPPPWSPPNRTVPFELHVKVQCTRSIL